MQSSRKSDEIKTRSRKGAILYFGYAIPILQQRTKTLHEAGYLVANASNVRSALGLIHKGKRDFAVLIIGERVPESERLQVSRAFRQWCPAGVIIVFYRDSVKNADAADALLDANRIPDSLVETVGALAGRYRTGD